jgi:hypothetical protein
VLWLAAAVLATGVGLLAVRLVEGQVSEAGPSALDARAVGEALASTAPTMTPTTTPTPAPSPRPTRTRPAASPTPRPVVSRSASPRPRALATGPGRTISTRGGVVCARCVGGEPRLVYATPADGYRIKDSSDERVRFENESDEIEIQLGCDTRNRVTAEIRQDESGGPG